MRAVVVHESLWGNTVSVAGANLIVAGWPVLAVKMSTDMMGDSIRRSPRSPIPWRRRGTG